MIHRRPFLRALLPLAAGWPLATVRAQTYPARAVRMIVPWPPGGLVDVAARQLSTRLQAAFGQPVVVENRAGAGGSLGADHVAKAAPDAHTLLFATSSLTIGAAMPMRQPFNLLRDLEPLALVAHAPSVLVVGPTLKVDSVKALIALARTQPGRLSYASAGVGSPAHLTAELFKTRHQMFIVHVPYTGAPAALNDQIAGQIDFQFANLTVALPQIRAGRVRALAVTSAQRFPGLPQVPTMAEAGVAAFEADQWLGLFAPRGAPRPATERLVAEVNRIVADDSLRAALTQAGMTPAAPGSAAAFESFVRRDLERWAAVVKSQNIQAE